jgi:broad specificity phosphatase PhoE
METEHKPPRRTLYLVRHGELDMRAFADDGFRAGLTARGREQARCTAERLSSVGATSIHSSTIGRAMETAEIIGKAFPHIPLRPSRLLWEVHPLGRATVVAKMARRADRAFRGFVRPALHQDCVDIVVSHGNLIRSLVCRILGVGPESWSSLGTSHCGITQVGIDGTRVQIVCYNETRHLPDPLRTN